MRIAYLAVALAAAAAPCPVHAQQPPLYAPCEDAAALMSPDEQRYCFAIAQTVTSAQPLLGILVAQGDPLAGERGAGRVRAGADSRGSAAVRFGAAAVRLPDVRQQATATRERLGGTAPAMTALATVLVFPGFSPGGGLDGVASVEVVLNGSWLPFNVLEVRGLASRRAEIACGAGLRIGLWEQTSLAPAASVSVARGRLGRVGYGDVCPAGTGAGLISGTGRGYHFTAGTCPASADPGEFSFDLTTWSGRTTLAKRIFGPDLHVGAGYDRFHSEVDFGLGAVADLPFLGVQPIYVRGSGLRLTQTRLSAFGGGAMDLGRIRAAAEGGWLRGSAPIHGFNAEGSAFDPRAGNWFGSLGIRFHF
jgi:hypothetical protein